MSSAARLLPVLKLASTPRPYVWRAGARRAFSTKSSLLAKRYSKNHEWIELGDDGKIATIGISEYAANALGDVVYVELPAPDLEVSAGDTVGAVESVKSASDIYAPVDGTIVEGNSALEEKPAIINKAPEGDGWLAKMEIKDASQLESLMSKEEYDAFEK